MVNKVEKINPSKRGELEISDLNKLYLEEGNLMVEKMNRGMTWFDTGTFDSLNDATAFIKSLEKRQGLKIGCPEEISWRMGYIDNDQLDFLSKPLLKSGYGIYLQTIMSDNQFN